MNTIKQECNVDRMIDTNPWLATKSRKPLNNSTTSDPRQKLFMVQKKFIVNSKDITYKHTPN